MPSPKSPPHFALLPAAGMGHLAPFLRLAVALSDRHHSQISLILPSDPTVSSAESLATSHLLSSHPQIHPLHLPLSPLPLPSSGDPFYLRYEAIRRSAHLLPPLLPQNLSALIVDISLASSFLPIARHLHLPCYILFTTSAAMLCFYSHFPSHAAAPLPSATAIGDVAVPALYTVPNSSVVPALHDPTNLFTTQFLENGQTLPKADGIITNTFDALEPAALAALNRGLVVPDLPPVIAIGPLRPIRSSNRSPIPWLDEQPARSVVYVSFGSRTAMSREQIKELGDGLEKSGWRFLWVLKTKKVDREEEEGFWERRKGRGLVVNGWVEQEEVLSHGAVGGFVSHCGWNSVSEAAVKGVKVLGWPRGADQRVNGEVVRRSGLGVWMEGWRWEAEEGVVSGEEIGEKVREFMEDEGLRRAAERVKEAAVEAVGVGGSSWKALEEFVGRFGV